MKGRLRAVVWPDYEGGKAVRRLTKALCALLAALTLAAGALAEPAPGAPGFLNGLTGQEPLSLDLTAQVSAWPDLSEGTLAALNAWLGTARLSLRLSETAGNLIFSLDGKTALTAVAEQDSRGAGLSLEVPGALPATRYLSGAETPPWALLLGAESRLPDFAGAAEALQAVALAAMPGLLPHEKPSRASVSLGAAGRGASRLDYVLNAEETGLFWQAVAPKLLPALARLKNALGGASALPDLSGAKPQGGLTVRRVLDKAGADLGFQVTGAFALPGGARRLSLSFGRSEKGTYLNLKLPALKGGDTLEARLNLKTPPGKMEGDWRVRSVSGKARRDLSGDVDLWLETLDAQQRVTGLLTVRAQTRGGEAPQDMRLEARPDLAFGNGALSGTLALRQSEGRALVREVSLGLRAAPGKLPAPPEPLAEVDLRLAGPEVMEREAARLRASLAPLVRQALLALPLPERLLVLHDLGRDGRTQGDSVAPPEPPLNEFTVSDRLETEVLP